MREDIRQASKEFHEKANKAVEESAFKTPRVKKKRPKYYKKQMRQIRREGGRR